ncbi:uncharacterized protein [Bemisia tabaci]|uniref:uncharacterized protein n=1 Tax=Bemisia tabaci TaxID=7038 RepID=UPI003B28AC56
MYHSAPSSAPTGGYSDVSTSGNLQHPVYVPSSRALLSHHHHHPNVGVGRRRRRGPAHRRDALCRELALDPAYQQQRRRGRGRGSGRGQRRGDARVPDVEHVPPPP